MSLRSTLTFDDQGTVQVLPLDDAQSGALVSDLLRRAGRPLNTRCGQRGLCRGCLVELVQGTLICRSTGQICEVPESTPLDAEQAGDAESKRDRLVRACDHALVAGQAVTLHIPPRSLLTHRPQVVTSFRVEVPWTLNPLVTDGAPAQDPAIGAAIDIGTTTVVVVLVDLASGNVVAEASALNAQIALGDNVLTRIERCQQDVNAVQRLQQLLVDRTLIPLIREASRRASIHTTDIQSFVIAGNTTMLHLLAGVDPSPLGVAPFQPTFTDARQLRSSALRIAPATVADNATWHLLPSAGAYVGADLVAGALATGLVYADRPRLLLDLGTNGEMILKHGDRFWGCATAAGPAFEGEGLFCGMRATDGAIAHVRLNSVDSQSLPQIDVIGNRPPIGLCGTAYLDFLAEGRSRGLLSPTGRLTNERSTNSPAYAGAGRAWPIATTPQGQPLVVTERDLSILLQAKAAIAAGMTCLLRRAGLQAADLERVDVAGGFGFHMAVSSLLGAGLLPGVRSDQVHLVGNASLAGAFAALMDRSIADELTAWATRVELIELNQEPDFESLYIDQLQLAAPDSTNLADGILNEGTGFD